MYYVPVAIIGAGQAGLAMSHCLTQRRIEHVVLERGRIAERWRSERWDSLRLLTAECRHTQRQAIAAGCPTTEAAGGAVAANGQLPVLSVLRQHSQHQGFHGFRRWRMSVVFWPCPLEPPCG